MLDGHSLEADHLHHLHGRVQEHFQSLAADFAAEQCRAPQRMRDAATRSSAVLASLDAQLQVTTALNAELDQLPECHQGLQIALAQTQRALYHIEALRTLLPESERPPPLAVFIRAPDPK
jgi:hypothetical protein